ncbi:hypothetical protein HMPREF3034_01667 [Prevotella sp. DNF00663]|nr:hypothetical protein HMPREF3034_01667 [Prevotella sp. DNF00663]
MICEQEHLSLLKVEEFLKDDLDNNLQLDEETGCWLPSAMFNVFFYPYILLDILFMVELI